MYLSSVEEFYVIKWMSLNVSKADNNNKKEEEEQNGNVNKVEQHLQEYFFIISFLVAPKNTPIWVIARLS